MSAPKAEKFPIQLMSLNAIKVDHALQSRARMSLEDQRDFSEAMLRGDQFPPVTVFYDGKTYWLADGFHRHAAAIKAQLNSIRAEVRHGTKRDAIVFSAGANQKFSIKRTYDDIKKAVWMLLDDEAWRKASPAMIAKHVGWKTETVRIYSSQYFDVNGIEVPLTICFEEKGRVREIPRAKWVETSKAARTKKLQASVRPIGLYGNSGGLAPRNDILESTVTPHSALPRAEAIAEARRIGDSTPGNGWRRLLWRMADLLEEATAESGPKGGETPDEDRDDAIAADAAIEDAEKNGTVPWEQVKDELGLEGGD